MYEITCLIILKLQLCCWVRGEEKKPIHFSSELQILLHRPMSHWLLQQFLYWTIILQSRNWHWKRESGLATETDNSGQQRSFNVPITTAPTILQINFRSVTFWASPRSQDYPQQILPAVKYYRITVELVHLHYMTSGQLFLHAFQSIYKPIFPTKFKATILNIIWTTFTYNFGIIIRSKTTNIQLTNSYSR